MTDKSRRVADWVDDIRETIGNIRSDIGTLSKPAFREDGKTQRAVIKGLTDAGEAANNIMKLTPGLRERAPGVWQHLVDIYAMRIRLTHTYHRTNPNIVFDTVLNDLPALEILLNQILAAHTESGDSDRRDGV